jgi:hypothetical protein
VLHTHGRNGQFNPHLHLIATSGGWRKTSSWRRPKTYASTLPLR